MADAVDQDQQWLINCLNATLDTDQQIRSFAEASLNQASLQPGFGSALSKVAANRGLPVGLRQISFSNSMICILTHLVICPHYHLNAVTGTSTNAFCLYLYRS
ncbi:hypothetical protein Dimus_031197 [Dionaea muscipula]